MVREECSPAPGDGGQCQERHGYRQIGYESATQVSRNYARVFGLPPAEGAARILGGKREAPIASHLEDWLNRPVDISDWQLLANSVEKVGLSRLPAY